MNIEPQTEGSILILNKLQKIENSKNLDEKDIEELINNPDIKRWLEAYGGNDKVYKIFRRSLLSIDEESHSDMDFWEKKIDYGFRKAADNIDKMRETIKEINNIDWGSVVQKSLKYLPENTELDPDFIVTVDGFNGGMFKNGTVFLSIIYFDRSQFKDNIFAHEFHHMGAEYWFKKNSIIQRYEEKHDNHFLTNIMKYLVSEGLANAYCSPGAITKTNTKDKDSEQFNQMIENYEENQDELLIQLENLIDKIISEPDEDLTEPYNDFTVDKEGVGLPPGHFLSGRMIMVMKESQIVKDKEIIDLVKNPFDFFDLYNKAAEELDKRKFSSDLVDKSDRLIEK